LSDFGCLESSVLLSLRERPRNGRKLEPHAKREEYKKKDIRGRLSDFGCLKRRLFSPTAVSGPPR
jgi:hypothetical protein